MCACSPEMSWNEHGVLKDKEVICTGKREINLFLQGILEEEIW